MIRPENRAGLIGFVATASVSITATVLFHTSVYSLPSQICTFQLIFSSKSVFANFGPPFATVFCNVIVSKRTKRRLDRPALRSETYRPFPSPPSLTGRLATREFWIWFFALTKKAVSKILKIHVRIFNLKETLTRPTEPTTELENELTTQWATTNRYESGARWFSEFTGSQGPQESLQCD